MTGHVMRNAKPLPGRYVIGVRPATGQPRDAEGRFILDWAYGAPPVAYPVEPPKHIDCPKRCSPVTRGARVEQPVQESLI